jgi:hypothetical protein
MYINKMEGLIKCSRCHSELLPEFYAVNRKGTLNKCCIPCLARFKCPHCPFRCSYNSYLQRHIKAVHDKIKDFECVICPYKCSDNGSLKKHIKVVHDKIKDFECSICPFKCSNNSNLKTHIKTCTGNLKCSSGELLVMNVLKALNITYLYNTSYGNVKHKGLLKWDFVIETSGEPLFIEYDGECHFLPVRYGGISQEKAESNLKSSKIRDKIKDDYCDNNGFLLLRIPYYEKENVFSLVRDFISENTL